MNKAILFFGLLVSAQFAQASSLSLRDVVKQAMQGSDYRAIESSRLSLDAPYLNSKAPLDIRVNLAATHSNNKSEAQSVFSPEEVVATGVSTGISTYFRTGTSLSLDLSHNWLDNKYSPAAARIGLQSITPQEATGRFSISQSLWKDGFGYGTRKALGAGALLAEAANLSYKSSKEDWYMQVISAYYSLWLAKTQYATAVENFTRRERLLKITKIKLVRGTVEEPDMLQLESAKIQSEIDLDEAKQRLQDTWRDITVTFKFDEAWQQKDPTLISIDLEPTVDHAAAICGSDNSVFIPPSRTLKIEEATIRADAASLSLQRSQNAMKPDLRLGFTYETNANDLDNKAVWNDVLSATHPAWTASLNVSIPLSRYAEKAQTSLAATELERAEALSEKTKRTLDVEWKNACQDLFRLKTATSKLTISLKGQLTRVSLDENRFKIGRLPVIPVIQTGDDATRTHFALQTTNVKYHLSAWRVLKLAGKLETSLDVLKETK